MSDRRSFSEIPREVLREEESRDRIDRIWARLERDLTEGRAPRRSSGAWQKVALAAFTFALGVGVGARFHLRGPTQAPLVVAEPEARSAGAAPASGPLAMPSAAGPALHGTEPSRRASATHRGDLGSTGAPEAPESTPKAAAVPEWQRLSDEGQYAQALAALEATGGFDAALRDRTADQLMSLVDIARATGERDRAIKALRRVVTEHGGDPNAPVAAWMLATELSKARDYAAAERAFATYRALSPNGDFAEDALARQMDMAVEEGHLEGARKLGEQYIKEFPSGPRAAEIRGELAAWTHDAGISSIEALPARSGADGGTRR